MNKKKIVWNITNKCYFDCTICATNMIHAGRKELSLYEKKRVLSSILSAEECVRELHFGGGDPLFGNDNREIIKDAVKMLGKSRVAISTTGKAIQTLCDIEKAELLGNVSISIDLKKKHQMEIRKTQEYSELNAAMCKEYRSYISNLTINTPLIQTNIVSQEIVRIIELINEISPDEVTLLRLMPVGKQKRSIYPEQYECERIIDFFRDKLKPNIKLHLHCALRCLNEVYEEQCTMGTNKLGVDCAGNVFQCCWSGYYTDDIEENPYYLGNLLDMNMKDIIKHNDVNVHRKGECPLFL